MDGRRLPMSALKLLCNPLPFALLIVAGLWAFYAVDMAPTSDTAPGDDPDFNLVVDHAATILVVNVLADLKRDFGDEYAERLDPEARREAEALYGDRLAEGAAEAIAPDVQPILRSLARRLVAALARPGDDHSTVARKLARQQVQLEKALRVELLLKPVELERAVVRGLEGAGLPVPPRERIRNPAD
jgi:hypothetical protein